MGPINLKEEARKSFKNHHESVQEFQQSMREMKSPFGVEKQLALQAIMRDEKHVFSTMSAWVRNSDNIDLNEIKVDSD